MKTALITGASNGIGLELAKIFAREKINLILVARNEQKLNELAKELAENGIEITIITKDLSITKNAEELYNELKSKGLAIDFLVNNAGFGLRGNITETDWQRELEMLTLNIVSLTYLSKKVAGDMRAAGNGRILNIGSTASFQPGPFMAVYCATKAYVLSFSEAINFELKGTGVSVTTLCPGVTETGFHVVAKTEGSGMLKSMSMASAEDVAKYGYKIMMKGKSMGVYGFVNKIMVSSVRFTPRSIVMGIAAKLLR